MSKFSDRVFGTNVDPDVLKIFNNLQNGSFEQNPNEPIVENKDYLGDRTTFARMWTASIISGSVTDPETEETRQEVEVNFHIVNDNRGKSYEPNKPIGDVVNTELSDNSYLKPKAGITSINTKNEGALGVIKNTTVEFVVHNKRQLEIMELLYMRPGFPILIEWGWSLYINNEGKRESSFPQIPDFWKEGASQNLINSRILQNKELTSGNYDGFLGMCKNFSFKARADGGFDCETFIIGQGEIIECL